MKSRVLLPIVVSMYSGLVLKKIVKFLNKTINLTEMFFLIYLKNFWRVKAYQQTGKHCNKQIMNF